MPATHRVATASSADTRGDGADWRGWQDLRGSWSSDGADSDGAWHDWSAWSSDGHGMTGAAMHPLTPGGVLGTAMARGMPRAAMARGMPRAAMARGDWMPKSNRSRGLAWLIN